MKKEIKKTNVMLYIETLEALCELPNEDLGCLVKHINDWNNGKDIVITNPFHKSMWKVILPDLERNKESYLTTLEKRQIAGRENGKLGGRPRKNNENQEKVIGFEEKVIGFEEKVINPNSNYNYNNTSKDVLVYEEQPGDGKLETPDGVSVSKGLESLEKTFPFNKRDIGIDEINLWNSFTQIQKANLIKSASLYVRKELQNEGGKYMRKLSKWMAQQNDKGVNEELLPKKKPDAKQTFKYVDGNIYSLLQDKLGSNKGIDYIYHILNTSGLTKEEFINVVIDLNQEELLELAKK